MLKGRFERLVIKGLLWVFILFLVGAAVMLSGATWEVHQKERMAYREREYSKDQFEETNRRHENLTASVESLSNDRGQEEEFRKRFPVAREGEEVIVLVDAKIEEIDTIVETDKSFWSHLKNIFSF